MRKKRSKCIRNAAVSYEESRENASTAQFFIPSHKSVVLTYKHVHLWTTEAGKRRRRKALTHPRHWKQPPTTPKVHSLQKVNINTEHWAILLRLYVLWRIAVVNEVFAASALFGKIGMGKIKDRLYWSFFNTSRSSWEFWLIFCWFFSLITFSSLHCDEKIFFIFLQFSLFSSFDFFLSFLYSKIAVNWNEFQPFLSCPF